MSEGDRVWLQYGDGGDIDHLIDSYCFERVHDTDVLYIRADAIVAPGGPVDNAGRALQLGETRRVLLRKFVAAALGVDDDPSLLHG